MEVVATVEKITEAYLIPVLEEMLKVFPFTIINFHSDNGSEYLNPYLNYHRPCHFPEIKINEKGKEVKVYPEKLVMTPYEKLKSLENAKQYLKEGITFEELDKLAKAKTDLEAGEELQEKHKKLFESIFLYSTMKMR